MADRTSTRSASRRTTPQPRPESIESRSKPSLNPPQLNMRITRSQSHDVSDSEVSRTGAAKYNRRRGTRQVSAEAVEDTGKISGRNKSRTKPGTHSREMQGMLLTIHQYHKEIAPCLGQPHLCSRISWLPISLADPERMNLSFVGWHSLTIHHCL